MRDNAFYTPRGVKITVFGSLMHDKRAKFEKNDNFMNRSIRRHLNEQKSAKKYFSSYVTRPPGVSQMVKKLDFLHFYPILRVFESFGAF